MAAARRRRTAPPPQPPLSDVPRADPLLLGGSGVVLLGLLLPWWDDGHGGSANGLHDWGWLSFLSLLLVVALFIGRRTPALRAHVPPMSVSDAVVHAVAGGAQLAGAVIFWFSSNAHIAGEVRPGAFVCMVGGALTAASGRVQWRR